MSLYEALNAEYVPPWRRRLTAEDVTDIRQLYHEIGWKQADIAEFFGITQPQVSKIVNNRQWKDV